MTMRFIYTLENFWSFRIQIFLFLLNPDTLATIPNIIMHAPRKNMGSSRCHLILNGRNLNQCLKSWVYSSVVDSDLASTGALGSTPSTVKEPIKMLKILSYSSVAMSWLLLWMWLLLDLLLWSGWTDINTLQWQSPQEKGTGESDMKCSGGLAQANS